jgi:penicillin amidase
VVRAKNLSEFKAAMSNIDMTFFNTVYADREGQIFFVYNGAIPRRDPHYDWTKTLDGTTSKTLWQGMHRFDELPSVHNPVSGFIQSCNSSPYTSTDDGNPLPIDFPKYMADDGDLDNLRSKVSRLILRDLKATTFEEIEKLAYDTRMYWPMVELPQYREGFPQLEKTNPTLAAKVRPLLTTLLDWDGRNREDCVQSTLCAAWYEIMYGTLYPPDGTLKHVYAQSIEKRYEALVEAAARLEKTFGKPLVPWGEVYRIQRHADVAEFLSIPFSDKKPSLPCVAVPGAMGAVFTQYYTPSIYVPFVKEMKKHYGVVGTSYIAVFEFGKDKIRGATLTQFGANSDPKSPHFFDQAKLMGEHKLRPELFDWKEVQEQAKRRYLPGEEARAAAAN